jgi:methylglutaconyl-CoA hydratase
MMSTPEPVAYEVRGRAAWITLASPATRNALSGPMIEALGVALDRALVDAAVRVVVLTGTGPVFCAGADLKGGGAAVAPGAGRHNPFVEILKRIWDGPKPVVVAANGHAFGGGVGLVAAADVSIAVEGTTFSFSEVRVGVIPAMISVVVLPKLGIHQTMRLFLTGRRFDAREALDYGLLHRVVPADGLEAAVEEEIDTIAQGGPVAVAEAKRLVRTVARLSMDEAFSYAEAKIAELFASAEAAEGMAAFAQKRKPSWAARDSAGRGAGS